MSNELRVKQANFIKQFAYPGPWEYEVVAEEVRNGKPTSTMISIQQGQHRHEAYGDPDNNTASVAGIFGKTTKRKEANAALMCEAANVLAETGLTPVDLLQTLEELEARVREANAKEDGKKMSNSLEYLHARLYNLYEGNGESHFNAIDRANKDFEDAGIDLCDFGPC